jgi:hypothetical protein
LVPLNAILATRRFQKYKNTDDKVQVCKPGQVDDEIEEKNIEAKLGKAKEIDDDGRGTRTHRLMRLGRDL